MVIIYEPPWKKDNNELKRLSETIILESLKLSRKKWEEKNTQREKKGKTVWERAKVGEAGN